MATRSQPLGFLLSAAIGLGLAAWVTGRCSDPAIAGTSPSDSAVFTDVPETPENPAGTTLIDRGRNVPVVHADLDMIRERGVLRVLTQNDSVSYFLHKGQALGFDHRMAELLAKSLGVRLRMVVPPSAEDLIPWLEQGRGDLIAAKMTVTPARRARVAFSHPYLYSDEVVVGPLGAKPLRSERELAGKRIHVRRSSSYAERLLDIQQRVPDLELEWVDERTSTEALLHKVGEGEIAYTVADDYLVNVENAWAQDVASIFDLTLVEPNAVDLIGKPRHQALEIAFAMRKDCPRLQKAVDAFVRKTYRSAPYNIAKRRYFEDQRRIEEVRANPVDGRISDYDAIIKRYAERYDFDWRLLAAQCCQESGFDPKAKSWVGALGLFQVMPATGKDMGFTNLVDPDEGVHAGVKYMRWLMDRFEGEVPEEERIYFALASYNGGRGHILDAMKIARQQGLDPQRWFGNVEVAIARLQDRNFAKRTRYGYCRAEEVIGYVDRIRSRYEVYTDFVPR